MEPQRRNSTSVLRIASCIGAIIISKLIIGRISSQRWKRTAGKDSKVTSGDSNVAAKVDQSPRSSATAQVVTEGNSEAPGAECTSNSPKMLNIGAIQVSVAPSLPSPDTVKPRTAAGATDSHGASGCCEALVAESVKPVRNQSDPATEVTSDQFDCNAEEALTRLESHPNVASLVESLEKHLVQTQSRSVDCAKHDSSRDEITPHETPSPDRFSDETLPENTSPPDTASHESTDVSQLKGTVGHAGHPDQFDAGDATGFAPCEVPPINLKPTPKWSLNINATPFTPNQFQSLSREGTPRMSKLDPSSKPFSPRSSTKPPSIHQMTFDPTAKPFTSTSSRLSNQLPPPPTPSTPRSATDTSQTPSAAMNPSSQKPSTPRPPPVKTFASVASANHEQQPKASSAPSRGKRSSHKHNAAPHLNPTAKPFTSAASKLNQQASNGHGHKPRSPSTPSAPLAAAAGCPTPRDPPAQVASSGGPTWAALVRNSIQASP